MDAVAVDEPLIREDQFAIRFTFSETMRARGRTPHHDQLSLCTVKASRIIREEIRSPGVVGPSDLRRLATVWRRA